MDMLKLAEEIIAGRRLTRQDDLQAFLTCDLDELCQGADKIRAACVGDHVDLSSLCTKPKYTFPGLLYFSLI